MGTKYVVSTNPGQNYKVNGRLKASSCDEIKKVVKSANQARDVWKDLDLEKRIVYVKKLLTLFKENESEIAELITKEIGTPVMECRDEVSWDFSYFQWFIDNVGKSISSEITYEDKASIHKIVYEPTGSVAVITPWNLPFDMFVWGVIPNLLVGNTVIYKAAEQCVLSEKLFEKISKKAMFPKGVLSFVYGDGEEGQCLIKQEIDMIWFTGSSSVGKEIYELAGKKFIKTVMEMGGSNPAIVFDDADLDLAVNSIVVKRFMFSGQTCDADKRVLVHKKIYKNFLEKFKAKIEQITVGDPKDTQTQMGPLVSERQLKLLESQIKDALDKGARVIVGGCKPKDLKGAYYLPTLLTNIKREMKVWKEEVFGPAIPISVFSTEKEAVDMANDTEYGLGSQVFTNDPKKAERISKVIKAGNVDINGIGHFKPFNPFGGYKMSGMGREHGVTGFRELCQIKVISMKK